MRRLEQDSPTRSLTGAQKFPDSLNLLFFSSSKSLIKVWNDFIDHSRDEFQIPACIRRLLVWQSRGFDVKAYPLAEGTWCGAIFYIFKYHCFWRFVGEVFEKDWWSWSRSIPGSSAGVHIQMRLQAVARRNITSDGQHSLFTVFVLVSFYCSCSL